MKQQSLVFLVAYASIEPAYKNLCIIFACAEGGGGEPIL